MLKYKCPVAHREVTTSIKTDTMTLLEMRRMKLSVWCPYCVTSHQIMATDAYVSNAYVASSYIQAAE